jgi:hypothetical protein
MAAASVSIKVSINYARVSGWFYTWILVPAGDMFSRSKIREFINLRVRSRQRVRVMVLEARQMLGENCDLIIIPGKYATHLIAYLDYHYKDILALTYTCDRRFMNARSHFDLPRVAERWW